MKLRFYHFVVDVFESIAYRLEMWASDIRDRISLIEDGPRPPSYSLEELDAQIQADMIKLGRSRNEFSRMREHRGH